MDKLKAKIFHQEVDAALQEIAEKHGYKYVPQNATFTPQSFKGRYEFLCGEAAETGVDPRERSIYQQIQKFTKLPPIDLYVTIYGKTMKAVGMSGHGIISWLEQGTNKPFTTNKRSSKMIEDGRVTWSIVAAA